MIYNNNFKYARKLTAYNSEIDDMTDITVKGLYLYKHVKV